MNVNILKTTMASDNRTEFNLTETDLTLDLIYECFTSKYYSFFDYFASIYPPDSTTKINTEPSLSSLSSISSYLGDISLYKSTRPSTQNLYTIEEPHHDCCNQISNNTSDKLWIDHRKLSRSLQNLESKLSTNSISFNKLQAIGANCDQDESSTHLILPCRCSKKTLLPLKTFPSNSKTKHKSFRYTVKPKDTYVNICDKTDPSNHCNTNICVIPQSTSKCPLFIESCSKEYICSQTKNPHMTMNPKVVLENNTSSSAEENDKNKHLSTTSISSGQEKFLLEKKQLMPVKANYLRQSSYSPTVSKRYRTYSNSNYSPKIIHHYHNATPPPLYPYPIRLEDNHGYPSGFYPSYNLPPPYTYSYSPAQMFPPVPPYGYPPQQILPQYNYNPVISHVAARTQLPSVAPMQDLNMETPLGKNSDLSAIQYLTDNKKVENFWLEKRIEDLSHTINYLDEKIELERKWLWQERFRNSAHEQKEKELNQIYLNEYGSLNTLSSTHVMNMEQNLQRNYDLAIQPTVHHFQNPQAQTLCLSTLNRYTNLLNNTTKELLHASEREMAHRELVAQAVNYKNYIENIEMQCNNELKQVHNLMDMLKNIARTNAPVLKRIQEQQHNVSKRNNETRIVELPKFKRQNEHVLTLDEWHRNQDAFYKSVSFGEKITEKFEKSIKNLFQAKPTSTLDKSECHFFPAQKLIEKHNRNKPDSKSLEINPCRHHHHHLQYYQQKDNPQYPKHEKAHRSHCRHRCHKHKQSESNSNDQSANNRNLEKKIDNTNNFSEYKNKNNEILNSNHLSDSKYDTTADAKKIDSNLDNCSLANQLLMLHIQDRLNSDDLSTSPNDSDASTINGYKPQKCTKRRSLETVLTISECESHGEVKKPFSSFGATTEDDDVYSDNETIFSSN